MVSRRKAILTTSFEYISLLPETAAIILNEGEKGNVPPAISQKIRHNSKYVIEQRMSFLSSLARHNLFISIRTARAPTLLTRVNRESPVVEKGIDVGGEGRGTGERSLVEFLPASLISFLRPDEGPSDG